MAAAPAAASTDVMNTTSIDAALSETPCACAKNTTHNASYSAVPFMLTVAPRGSTKLLRWGLMPARSQHWMVTGRVATEDDVPNAVISACSTCNENKLDEKPNLTTAKYCRRDLRHGAHEGVGIATGEDEVKQGQHKQRVNGE